METGGKEDPKTINPDDSRDKGQQDTGQPSNEPEHPVPGPKKISEQPDYLRKREDWFRKRSS